MERDQNHKKSYGYSKIKKISIFVYEIFVKKKKTSALGLEYRSSHLNYFHT